MTRREHDEQWMRIALHAAREASASGDVPVGAVIVCKDHIISHAGNRTARDQDATGHAELIAIRAACEVKKSWRLDDCTLYVTLEPCAMCAGGVVLARLERVVFGAWDEKAGMAGSIGDIVRHPRLNHRPEVQGGVLEADSAELLRAFFATRRARDFVDTPPASG